MASIQKRGSTYKFTVSCGRGMDKKQVRKTMTYTPISKTPAKIKKEVAKAAADFESAVKSGRYYNGEKETFEQFTENKWRPLWASKKLTLSQQERYYFYIERYGYPTLRTLKINQINTLQIQEIIDSQSERLAPQTVKHIYTAINSVFKYAFNKKIIDENPCIRCDLPPIEQDDKLHFFTRDQAAAFLDSLADPFTTTYRAHSRTDDTGLAYNVREYSETHYTQYQFRALFALAIYGGLRRGEIVALQWQDIDFDNSTVSVRRAFARVKSGMILKEPKTKKSTRSVTMPAECMDLLRSWKKQQQELCIRLGSQWQGKRGKDYDENFVFIQTDSGKAMDLSTPTQKFPKLLKRYNEMIDQKIKEGTAEEEDKLPIIRFHDLRHTSATLLIANGADIETIAHRLGHSRVSMTLDRYGHALPENDVKAAQTLERIFAR